MDLGLKGKKALVTGGTRGIGRAIAETLAAEGCDVGICARDGDAVAEAVKALEGQGVKATGSAVDVTDRDALKAWVNDSVETLGGLNIFVSNVSAMAITPDDASWQTSFDVDIMGTVVGIEAATPHLTESGEGAIVIVGSVASIEVGGVSPYAAVKAALLPYAKGLANSLAPKNVRANTVSPGSVYFEGGVWDMIKQGMPKMYESTLKRNKLGRMASPQDVANAVAFLASPAASFITGTNVIVDGALTNRVQY